MAVLDPIIVELDNLQQEMTAFDVPDFPFDPTRGSHKIVVEKVVYIDRSDFRLVDDPDYFGLAPNKSVSLKYAFTIKCVSYELDENGKVVSLKCSVDASSSAEKPKGSIQWVPASTAITFEVRFALFFTHPSEEVLFYFRSKVFIRFGGYITG